MRHPPVVLQADQRDLLRRALAERFLDDGVELIALTVATNHFHLLARFPTLPAEEQARFSASLLGDGRDPAPRHWLGLARKHASHVLHDAGLKPTGPVWAARPKCDPIRDRGHQCNVAHYIRGHARLGAAVMFLDQFTPAAD